LRRAAKQHISLDTIRARADIYSSKP
jgi:hypothetical protein